MKAKVMQLDRQKQRLSLGLKPSYFEGDSDSAMDAAELDPADGNVSSDLDADMAELRSEEEEPSDAEHSSGDPSILACCSIAGSADHQDWWKNLRWSSFTQSAAHE